MAIDFMPQKDSDRLDWTSNFKTQIALAATALGLTTQQVTDFAHLVTICRTQ